MSAQAFRFGEVRDWLTAHAWPLWTTAGLDLQHGGAVESLAHGGGPSGCTFKRIRVQARQVYAFSHAHLMGWDGPALQAAEHCWTFLDRRARREDRAWPRTTRPDGTPLDPAMDAYDMAFVIFALAWRARTGDPDALAEAHRTLDRLNAALSLGPGQGWRAAEDDPARLLNPHMHLLEASTEMAAATGDERFREMAAGLLSLFSERLFDRARGELPEVFGEDWGRAVGPGQRLEPGHYYEWAWLLHRAGAATDVDVSAEARALYDLAEARGIDPETRLVFDALDEDGSKPRPTFRSWPQTEALKAALAMFEHQGLDTRARIVEVTGQLLDRYLAVEPRGAWMDQFGPGFAPMAADTPASILYHLQLAFAELLRLEPELSRPPGAR